MPLRWRMTLLAAAVLTVLLACCGLLFVTSLTTQLESDLDEVLAARAGALAGRIEPDGTLDPDAAATSRGGPVGSAAGAEQVLTTDGRVVHPVARAGATPPAPLLPVASLAAATPAGTYVDDTTSAAARAQETGRIRVLATAVPAVHRVVVVSESLDGVEDTVEAARTRFAVVGVILLLGGTLGAWMITGAALARVEHLRRQAAALSASETRAGVGAATGAGRSAPRLTVPRGRDEITRLAATFDDLLARLHAALERERAFTADAGHELRTPLTVLRGELDLASRPGTGEADLRRAVDVASAEAARLTALTDDLLTLSRAPAAGPLALLDLADVVLDAVHRLDPLAAEAGIELVGRAEPRVVRGHAGLLDRAVTNGVVNAIRHADGARTITVTARVDDDRAVVEIADDGTGFPADFLPRAFDRFSRATPVRGRDEGGTGLGLAIVAAAMAAHGGTAAARNRSDGQGAALTLSWPAADLGPDPLDSTDPLEATGPVAADPHVTRGSEWAAGADDPPPRGRRRDAQR